jgi:hypothetical protein
MFLSGVGALALAMGPAANAAVFVDDTPEAAWRTNGPVLATKIIGDTLVVGGSFSEAISPNGQTHVTRNNLAAFSLSTGALLTGWQANTDGIVRALDSDDGSVWVGGYFTHIGGQARGHIAKLDVSDGSVDGAFSPNLNNAVRAIEVAEGSVVAGGTFTRLNNVGGHPHIIKLDANNGSLDAQFAGSASKAVWSLVKSPTDNVIYAGGQFDILSGVAREGAGALNFTTGAVVGPPLAGSPRPTIGLDISPDGTLLYGALVSNTCVAWRTSTGVRAWGVRTQGNVQAVKYFSGTVYCGFHDSFQNDETIKLVAANATTGAVDLNFLPSINTFLGVRAIDVSADGVVIGGNFTVVSGVSARGFAIFRP